MSDDVSSRVAALAALEVHVKNHKEKLDEIKVHIDDLYSKYGADHKDLAGTLTQFRAIVSEFSAITIKIQEIEDNINPMANKLDSHIGDFNTFVEKNNVFQFIKDNPGLTIKIFLIGGVMIGGIYLLAQSVPGMAILKFFAGLVGLRF